MHELRVDEREACELGLVDVGDDQLVWWRELRLGASEELVEVLCRFAALWRGDAKVKRASAAKEPRPSHSARFASHLIPSGFPSDYMLHMSLT